METEGGERIAGMVVGWRRDAAEEERERGEIGRGREERRMGNVVRAGGV